MITPMLDNLPVVSSQLPENHRRPSLGIGQLSTGNSLLIATGVLSAESTVPWGLASVHGSRGQASFVSLPKLLCGPLMLASRAPVSMSLY
jgi:hypothetical protein